jgi:hypothetical protein
MANYPEARSRSVQKREAVQRGESLTSQPPEARQIAEQIAREAIAFHYEGTNGSLREILVPLIARALTEATATAEAEQATDVQRLRRQAQDISQILADANVGACPIVEGVRKLANWRGEAAAQDKIDACVRKHTPTAVVESPHSK